MMLKSTIIEAEDTPTGCVIWLHGLGAYGQEFAPVVPHMGLPFVRFVFPQSLDRPVTINGGVEMPAWFDIRSLMDTADRESQVDIAHSTALIEEVIAGQIADGIPAHRIILMGFSQGGAMALHVGLRYRASLLGIAVLSGYMLSPMLLKVEESAENRSTPLFFGHGRRDLVVAYDKGRRAYTTAKNTLRTSTWHAYQVGHELCMTELADLRIWLQALFNTP